MKFLTLNASQYAWLEYVMNSAYRKAKLEVADLTDSKTISYYRTYGAEDVRLRSLMDAQRTISLLESIRDDIRDVGV